MIVEGGSQNISSGQGSYHYVNQRYNSQPVEALTRLNRRAARITQPNAPVQRAQEQKKNVQDLELNLYSPKNNQSSRNVPQGKPVGMHIDFTA